MLQLKQYCMTSQLLVTSNELSSDNKDAVTDSTTRQTCYDSLGSCGVYSSCIRGGSTGCGGLQMLGGGRIEGSTGVCVIYGSQRNHLQTALPF